MAGLDNLNVLGTLVDDVLAQSEAERVATLIRDVSKSYMRGQIVGSGLLGESPSPARINSMTAAFMRYYSKLAVEEGVTIINGKKVPWLKTRTEEERSEIYRIINEGLNKGTYPGRKEGALYSEGSIGQQLQSYFNERRSQSYAVARTETGRILNIGKLDMFSSRGVEEVTVKDGDGANPCDICKQYNNQVWTLEYAMTHELEHPNCVRTFLPVRPEGGLKNNISVQLSAKCINNHTYVVNEVLI